MTAALLMVVAIFAIIVVADFLSMGVKNLYRRIDEIEKRLAALEGKSR